MERWVTGIISKGLLAFLCIATIIWVALWYLIPAPPTTISIAAGIPGGAYEHIAKSYRERLARSHITLDIRFAADGAAGNLRLVENRSSGVDAAFLFGGVTNSKQSPDLMSMGRISYVPVWLFYRGPETLDRLAQLKGKRIAAGVAFRSVASRILDAHGVNSDNAALLPHLGAAAAKALKDGDADVFWQVIDLNSPVIQSLLRDPTVRLMNFAQADALTRVFPYLNRLVLPQGVIDLEKNIPASDVNLIASTNVVVVRKDLHPQLVYLLAQTLSEEHGGAGIFQRAGDFPTQPPQGYRNHIAKRADGPSNRSSANRFGEHRSGDKYPSHATLGSVF